MSAAPHRQRSPSPPSGRDSPVPASRASRRPLEDGTASKDKGYRRYASAIERALAFFNSTRLEWPDYISCLGRLLKALQSHPAQVDVLPHKAAIANRLSQCLSPSLPSGVHQKAIEVYGFVFDLIGRHSLTRDLPDFLPGLAPVLSFASLSIRPSFLSLLESHILALSGQALRPATRALILALSPALEDETSEDFDRILQDVDRIKASIRVQEMGDQGKSSGSGDQFFWQCLFQAAISSKSRRPGILAYLSRRLPRLVPESSESMSDGHVDGDVGDILNNTAIASVVSPEPGLLVRCFASGLEDEQLLLQRGYLDLLLTHLPLHSPVITKRLNSLDLQRLVTAAMNVVARRDMSLNRRLWSWFLGPDSDDEDESSYPISPTNTESLGQESAPKSVAYFESYGVDVLTKSVLAQLTSTDNTSSAKAKPYRICLSLMDRWEVGGLLIPRVFVPAMQHLLQYKQSASTSEFREVVRSASSFFDGIDSGVIWSQIVDIVHTSLSDSSLSPDIRCRKMELARFVVSTFNVREEEMLAFHMPLACLLALDLIHRYVSLSNPTTSTCESEIIVEATGFAEQLVGLMPERVHLNASFGDASSAHIDGGGVGKGDEEILKQIKSFYHDHSGNLASSPPPFSSQKTAELLLQYSAALFVQSLDIGSKISNIPDNLSKTVSNLLLKTPECDALEFEKLVASFERSISSQNKAPARVSFSTLYAVNIVLMNLISKQSQPREAFQELNMLIASLIEGFWSFLAPTSPEHHVEAVRALSQLDEILPEDRILESTVSKSLASQASIGISGKRLQEFRRFTVLWTHANQTANSNAKKGKNRRETAVLVSKDSPEDLNPESALSRPFLVLLDVLDEDESEIRFFLTNWLKNVHSMDAVITSLLEKLLQAENKIARPASNISNDDVRNFKYENEDRTSECLYYLKHLLNVLRLSSDSVAAALTAHIEIDDSHSILFPEDANLEVVVAGICLKMLQSSVQLRNWMDAQERAALQRISLLILQQLLTYPDPHPLKALDMEDSLLDILSEILNEDIREPSVFVSLLQTTLAYLTLKYSTPIMSQRQLTRHRKTSSIDAVKRQSGRNEAPPSEANSSNPSHSPEPPKKLFQCLQVGLSTRSSRFILDHWVNFLIEVLPLYSSTIFQNMIPFVDTFCKEIKYDFGQLKAKFASKNDIDCQAPESTILYLLSGLEHVLMAAHGQLNVEESTEAATKGPEPAPSLFGNITSGVFSYEAGKGRSSAANSRLTVILCLQDAIRVCLSIWAWGSYGQSGVDYDASSSSSFAYVSARLRSRSRRLLDRLFNNEALECLETLVLEWKRHREHSENILVSNASVIKLLHVLDGSRPKRTMPALFNAIYSRTSPQALDSNQKSSLTCDISDIDLGEFLILYTESLDDDAMDEIWMDCMAFLKDVLASPLSQSHVLPSLLVLLLTLAEKVENTNFGEQRKMRKDLSDLFLRLVTATLTSRSTTSVQELTQPPQNATTEKELSKHASISIPVSGSSVIDVLAAVLPRFQTALSESDKLVNSASVISSHALVPVHHSKSFPENLRLSWLQLLQNVMKIPQATKTWKKDAAEVFNHGKLFSMSVDLVEPGLIPAIRQWALTDKDRLPEVLGRIASPTSAGMMFAVGATAARTEADKKAQLNMRRVALLIMSLEDDSTVPHSSALEEKITELLQAHPTSSPSSSTRPEIFMVLRAVVLKNSSIHLASLWPVITAELQKALTSAVPKAKEYDTYGTHSLLQACKLLDLLILLQPDDFQMHEWLFITDTIDTVYRPESWEPVGLVDDIAEQLGPGSSSHHTRGILNDASSVVPDAQSGIGSNMKKSLLPGKVDTTGMAKEEFVRKVLIPFFNQLSIHSFESTYSMGVADWEGCKRALLEDVFDDSTLVS
ncbi:MAG: hypothetical protein M1831_005706 [Alyxoria varia]|nr:MAG: hypothetical protein M1831_005706 [Alyxoria varia]